MEIIGCVFLLMVERLIFMKMENMIICRILLCVIVLIILVGMVCEIKIFVENGIGVILFIVLVVVVMKLMLLFGFRRLIIIKLSRMEMNVV